MTTKETEETTAGTKKEEKRDTTPPLFPPSEKEQTRAADALAKADADWVKSQIRFESENYTDEEGNPAGGFARGTGIDISWQDGPLGRGDDRKEPNGAFVEDVIRVAKQRLEFYQGSRFATGENQEAIDHLGIALLALETRTRKRVARGVEGLNEE